MRKTMLGGWSMVVLAACHGGVNGATQDVPPQLQSMELTSDSVPAAPTNRYADDARAAELGRALFFDPRLSSDGTVACASCHKADEGFADSERVSLGVGGAPGKRHAMTVAAASLHPFLMWDGRADSQWSQPLKALENPIEMNFTRAEVAHFVAASYAGQYAAIFGALPDLDGVVARAAPGSADWDALAPSTQDAIQRVFANVGKSLEAYERRLTCSDTRFDQWVRGDLALTSDELAGANAFVNDGCIRCHTGPSFSDGKFHDLGIGAGDGDTGREAGITALLADPFNGAGAYSDDVTVGRAKLAEVSSETGTRGAFRTASLRGVGQREFFGHLGAEPTVRDFIQTTYRGHGGRGGGPAGSDPLLQGVKTDDLDQLVAFLQTLDCPPLPADLRKP